MDTDEEYGEALPASGSGRGKKDFPRALSWSILVINQGYVNDRKRRGQNTFCHSYVKQEMGWKYLTARETCDIVRHIKPLGEVDFSGEIFFSPRSDNAAWRFFAQST